MKVSDLPNVTNCEQSDLIGFGCSYLSGRCCRILASEANHYPPLLSRKMTTRKTSPTPEDSGSRMAELIAAATAAISQKASKPKDGSKDKEQFRCVWPESVEKAASQAGIRLPGLYPTRQGGRPVGAPQNGWYRKPALKSRLGEPRGDVARTILWALVGAQLAANGEALVEDVLMAAAALKAVMAAEGANRIPDWATYLISDGASGADGKPVGAYTCILQQLAAMAGGPVVMTVERITKL